MSFRDSLSLPFEHDLPLELGNRAKNRQHHFSGRAGSVKIHIQDAQPGVRRAIEIVDDIDPSNHEAVGEFFRATFLFPKTS
jgi:hypothetical protein